jgi:two-component system, NtrC family, sensor kinase
MIKRHPIKPGRHAITARVALERRTIHVADLQADPEYKYVRRDVDPIRTELGVPMFRGNDLVGVIILYKLVVQPFTDKQIELVTTFADQAVIAIENVRLFEAEQQRTRELAKSLEDLRTTQDRLVQTQKLASLGQLTAGIAHEIKNPLNFVNNFSGVSAELIDELREALGKVKIDTDARAEITELTDTLRDNLDKIVQHCKRADSIVKNMFTRAKARANIGLLTQTPSSRRASISPITARVPRIRASRSIWSVPLIRPPVRSTSCRRRSHGHF